ncbi:MAG: hypothetical protein JWO59_3487 [Chloroflexi bacterium]|nr:hypothetical protein [Chloroflexota bacterium]
MFWTGRGSEHKLFIDTATRIGGVVVSVNSWTGRGP